MREKGLSGLGTVAVAALLLAFVPPALGKQVVCLTGSGKGQCLRPQNLAVDPATNRLFVVDGKNNRVNVFGPTGVFEETFGWGVKNGSSEFQICGAAQPTCRVGIAGAGSGQFNSPQGIAIDTHSSPSTIYVTDVENRRVEKFSDSGEFLLTFGKGVNKTTGGDICTALSGNTCGAGSNGSGEGEFTSLGGEGIFVGVDATGTVYVVDTVRDSLNNREARLQKFNELGVVVSPQHLLFAGAAQGMAVEAGGDFWVTKAPGIGEIRKYKPDGSLILNEEVPDAGGIALAGVAIDGEGHLFVSYNAFQAALRSIIEYDAAGNIVRWFGYGEFESAILGLAFYESASGDIYASEESGRVLHVDFPPPGPIVIPEPCRVKAGTLANTEATLEGEFNPEGKASTYHFEYVTDAHFLAEGFNGATKTLESTPTPATFEVQEASAPVTGLTPETTYHCRLVAKNVDGEDNGPEGTFTTKGPFEFGQIWASEVGIGSAEVHAEVNPLGITTEAQFEYVDDASFQAGKFAAAKTAPAQEIGLGGGKAFVTASATISGLAPGTLYHYRLRVKDAFFPAGIPCPGKEEGAVQKNVCFGEAPTFATFPTPSDLLPDGRKYELVSPAQKNSAEVAVPGAAGGFSNEGNVVKIQAGAGAGEAITYTSWTSFADAEGAPIASQYLSRRGAGGWGTENISPFGFLRNPLNAPFLGFSPELTDAGFVVDEPPLADGALQGLQNLYRRDNQGGALQALTQGPNPDFTAVQETGLTSFCTRYAGASADGSRTFFAANGAFTQAQPPAPVGTGFSLYERSPAGLSLVSVLPDGNPAAPALKTRFGDEGGSCSMDQGAIAHAISADGSKVFWSYGGKFKTVSQPLLARIDGFETIQLDAPNEGVAGKGGGGEFRAASPDGSRVLFTAPTKLTADGFAAVATNDPGDLYRYDFGKPAGERLTDLTPGSTSPEIEGVIGASEDGTYAYFVAAAVLSGAEVNGTGQKAEGGENNLYLWHEGEPIRFIGQLASAIDEEDWNSVPERLSARVAPDGRHLAFLSSETKALSGYDNTVATGSHCQVPHNENRDTFEGSPACRQAYIYDAPSKTLTCASCNPSGARPLGPAVLPGWSNPFEGPRYLSADGGRLFFESFDALSDEDKNKKRDVYEFERAGMGDCSNASLSFSAKSGGCVALISNAKSEDHSYLLDASTDGGDVFFATRQALVGWDDNPNYDVYDARVGGGFPEPPAQAPPCQGEACRPPASPPPAPPAPATNAFNGPANPKPKKPKPHKKKHKHKKHHHAKNHRANPKPRASR